MSDYLTASNPQAISALTGRQNALEQALRFAGGPKALGGVERIGGALASILPGAGEYLSAQDSRGEMDNSMASLETGEYGPALSHFGLALLAAAGAIPVIGSTTRIARKAGNIAEAGTDMTRQKAFMQALDDISRSARKDPAYGPSFEDYQFEQTRKQLGQ